MIVGARILERMDAVGLSQAELARRVGLAQPTIFNLIHRGKKGSTKLHLIARELETTPAYLTGETDDASADLGAPPALDAETRRLVQYFPHLAAKDRKAIMQLVESLASRLGTETHKGGQGAALHDQGKEYRGE